MEANTENTKYHLVMQLKPKAKCRMISQHYAINLSLSATVFCPKKQVLRLKILRRIVEVWVP